jgi:hypothetical protein
MNIEITKYYDDFLRYHKMATTQQAECNLGIVAHEEGSVKDPLMQNVHLYDVVNRKYAGFTQILLDMWYGHENDHPYWGKLHEVRTPIAKSFTGVHGTWKMAEWLYVFLVHRVTGSGINYAKKPSGYNNTILPQFKYCEDIDDMVKAVQNRSGGSIYTSVGYQFCAFPKPTEGYRLGGDYFLCEFAPKLARDLADLLPTRKWNLRDLGHWMWDWNKRNGLRAYKFQYAAFVADVADFYPEHVDRASSFFYGTNAEECISYLAKPLSKGPKIDFLDAVMDRIHKDTCSVPYDAEDVACDYIRFVENYVRPGHDYQHLDRDSTWNTSQIQDHPYGRQKAMLDLGLIGSFNPLTVHPSDDYVLSRAGVSAQDYRLRVNGLD